MDTEEVGSVLTMFVEIPLNALASIFDIPANQSVRSPPIRVEPFDANSLQVLHGSA
jgi:hypothetical protein